MDFIRNIPATIRSRKAREGCPPLMYSAAPISALRIRCARCRIRRARLPRLLPAAQIQQRMGCALFEPRSASRRIPEHPGPAPCSPVPCPASHPLCRRRMLLILIFYDASPACCSVLLPSPLSSTGFCEFLTGNFRKITPYCHLTEKRAGSIMLYVFETNYKFSKLLAF